MTYKINITTHDKQPENFHIAISNLFPSIHTYPDKTSASISAKQLASKIAKEIGGNIAQLRNTKDGNLTILFNQNGSSLAAFGVVSS